MIDCFMFDAASRFTPDHPRDLATRVHTELLEDSLRVPACGVLTDAERSGNLPVSYAIGQVERYSRLARRE